MLVNTKEGLGRDDVMMPGGQFRASALGHVVLVLIEYLRVVYVHEAGVEG